MYPFQGTIQVVLPGNPFNTEYGPKYNLRLKLEEDGEWYKVPFVKPEKLGAFHVGVQISGTFVIKVNGEYQNREIDPKTLNFPGGQQQAVGSYQAPVQQQAPPHQVASQATRSPVAPKAPPRSPGNVGARVGNAINNAAAILGPGVTVAQLEETAFDILDMASRLEAGRPQKAAKQVATPPVQAPVQQPAPQQAAQQAPAQQAQTAAAYQPTYQAPAGHAPIQHAPQPGAEDFDDDIPF